MSTKQLLSKLALSATALLTFACSEWEESSNNLNEQLAREFQTKARYCGIRHEHASIKEALECRVAEIRGDHEMSNRQIFANGIIAQDHTGKVIDIHMYDVEFMLKSHATSQMNMHTSATHRATTGRGEDRIVTSDLTIIQQEVVR